MGRIDRGRWTRFSTRHSRREFGLGVPQFAEFVSRLTGEAVERGAARFWLPKTEVTRRLRDAGAPDPERAFETLALAPRTKWDERKPANARPRDWYPWRYNRRLSVVRRPLMQISNEKNPDVLILPGLVWTTFRFLWQTMEGNLPVELFDSPEMRSWIGRAVDRHGHAFNRRVADRFTELGWRARSEVKLTELGGGAELGDIDVLAWRPAGGPVHAIECKRLMFERTVGEVGERLAEYTCPGTGGGRTPAEKHLDRVVHLRSNRKPVARLTSIPSERLEIQSVLVTEDLGPLQFAGRVHEFFDVVTNYDGLADIFGSP